MLIFFLECEKFKMSFPMATYDGKMTIYIGEVATYACLMSTCAERVAILGYVAQMATCIYYNAKYCKRTRLRH